MYYSHPHSHTAGTNGRLGNQIIRSVALSLLAEKHNLYVEYFNYHIISDVLGIRLFSGENKFTDTRKIFDEDFFELLECNGPLRYNLDPNNDWFQSEEVTNAIYTHLHTDPQKADIMGRNPFGTRYNNNNDLYIHVRLGDLAQYNPGVDYYLDIIKRVHHSTLYLSSDDASHTVVTTIQSLYPAAQLVERSPAETIQFASTCKHVALTFGSFSAVIGYLAFFSDVYYTSIDRPFPAGPIGMFIKDGWIPV